MKPFVLVSCIALLPMILFAESSATHTKTQATAAIAAEMEARELRKAERKAAIEAVPALQQWEVDHGNHKTILRRVAPPVPHSPDESQIAPSTEEA